LKILNIQVAMVPGDPRYWIDRRIMEMDGRGSYSHAAFMLTIEDRPTEWWDVHHRWLASSLRRFPASIYGYPYETWDIVCLTAADRGAIGKWLLGLAGWRMNYDFFTCVAQYLAFKAGTTYKFSPRNTPSVMRCFELIQRGLELTGRKFEAQAETALGYDLVISGHLRRNAP
jgi:hypothetical protein